MRPRARRSSRRPIGRARLSLVRDAVIAAGVGLCAVASAWAANDPFEGVEEMIVSGDGRLAALEYDDVSVIAFDAEQIEAIGAADISDIAEFTPNLEIRSPFAASSPTLFIRGVGIRDFTASSSSSVAVYVDETQMNSSTGQLAQLFDTENVEVLRGPQVTRHARNASAGTLRVVSRKPTGTPGTNVSVTYGRFNQVDVDVAVENVIVPDRLSIRSAAQWSSRDGITKNRCADIDFIRPPPRRETNTRTPQGRANIVIADVSRNCYQPANINPIFSPPAPGWDRDRAGSVKDWVNDRKNWGARTILRFQHPTYDMDWQLNLHGGQNRGDARQFQVIGADQRPLEQTPTPSPDGRDDDTYFDADNRQFTAAGRPIPVLDPFIGNPYEGDYDKVEKEKIDLFGGSLVGRLRFGEVEVTSITAYEWSKRDTTINLDGSPSPSLHLELDNRAYQLSQEIRVGADDDGPFDWELGGLFLYDAIEARNFFPFSLTGDAIGQDFTFFTRSTNFWADAGWEPNERFSIEVGARFNYEEKELNLVRQSLRQVLGTGARIPTTFPASDPRAGQPLPPRFASSATKAFGWAGRVVLTWRPTADVDLFLSYTRGWKGPHINSAVVNPGPDGSDRGALSEPVAPEKLDSVELGTKSSFWGGRVGLSAALFYYDYQDLQVFALRNGAGTTPVTELINADDADILGFEMEADLRPFEGWAPPALEPFWIRLTFSWLDAYYTDFVNIFTVQNIGDSLVERTQAEDFTGNRIVNSPEFAFVGFVAWPIPTRVGTFVPRFDWSFKDEVFFSPDNSPLVAQDALWLLNVRLAYRSPDESIVLAGWVRNLTDQAYTQDVFNLARLRSAILHAIGEPRTYGVSLSLRF